MFSRIAKEFDRVRDVFLLDTNFTDRRCSLYVDFEVSVDGEDVWVEFAHLDILNVLAPEAPLAKGLLRWRVEMYVRSKEEIERFIEYSQMALWNKLVELIAQKGKENAASS